PRARRRAAAARQRLHRADGSAGAWRQAEAGNRVARRCNRPGVDAVTSARRVAVLVGAPCAPFRDGMAAAVATPWEIVATGDDLVASAALIGRADAIVT